jgi:hypothetical protein
LKPPAEPDVPEPVDRYARRMAWSMIVGGAGTPLVGLVAA